MLRAYTIPEAARLVDWPYRTVKRWIDTEVIHLRLHHPIGDGDRGLLSYEDVAELWLIRDLRDQGVSLQRIKRILVWVARYDEYSRRRLRDYKAVWVDEETQEVIAIEDGEPEAIDLETGQRIMIDLRELHDRMEQQPGEPMAPAWESSYRALERQGLV